MNLLRKVLDVQSRVLESLDTLAIRPEDLIPLLDLTLLDPNASDTALTSLCNRANQYGVAAVCVLPMHLEQVRACVQVARATVLNFPSGLEPLETVLHTLNHIHETTGVEELDYVFPWPRWQAGETREALEHARKVTESVHAAGKRCKIILETGAFQSLDALHTMATSVLETGCDFLKTSTGKTDCGVTFEAAFTLLEAIRISNPSCGLKVSGGVKTPKDARMYYALAQYMTDRTPNADSFRIGASSLLDALLSLQT